MSIRIKKKLLNQYNEEQFLEIVKVCNELSNINIDCQLFVEGNDDIEDNFYRDNMDDETKLLIEKRNKGEITPKRMIKKTKKNNNVSITNIKKLNLDEIKGTDVFENDIVTLKVNIRRPDENKLTDGNVKAVYAPFFPGVVKEVIWIVLSEKTNKIQLTSSPQPRSRQQEPNVHAMERITSQSRLITKELKFMAPPKIGTYSMTLQVFSDSYIGFDIEQDITFTVRSAEELPEYEWDEEDLNLEDNLDLFKGLALSGIEEDNDSSDDEDNEPQKINNKDNNKINNEELKKTNNKTLTNNNDKKIDNKSKTLSNNKMVIVEDNNNSSDDE